MKNAEFLVLLVAGTLLLSSGCGTTQVENSKSELSTHNSELETCIQLLIKQLGDNDQRVREQATNELILIGKPAEPYLEETLKAIRGKDAEAEIRISQILKAMSIYERVTFSDYLLKEFPSIYEELALGDAKKRFAILQKITEMDGNNKSLHKLTEDDIAGVMGEVLLDGGRGWLSPEQKKLLCRMSMGHSYSASGSLNKKRNPYDIRLGWYKKIPAAVPHIIKLLKDEDADVCSTAVWALDQLGVSDEEIEKAKK